MTPRRAGIIALLAGFAVMSLELTAVRLMAPHFGDSAFVWTNVIGVMLLALAAGAWLGGRLGPRGPLALLLLGAGLLVAAAPPLSMLIGPWLLPQDLRLDEAMPALVRGSLAATLLLFAPPVTLIGCITPMLVARLAKAGVAVGRASGLVAATSTIGSLLGTFATTHLLLPDLGSRATVWTCAALLLVCATSSRPGRAFAAWILLPFGLMLLPWGPLRAQAPNEELLAEVESPYQYLRVVQREAAGKRTTILQINEGLDSFHSVAVEGTAFTGGRYYDAHVVLPFLVGDGVRPRPLRVLSLGDAAGSFSRLYGAVYRGCTLDSVELDPAVVALGARWFGGRGVAGRTFAGLGARVFVEHAHGPYEVILVDAYERQIYIPAHLASREFFTAVRRLLVPGGVVSVNVGGLSFADPVVSTLAHTMAAVFGRCHAFRVPRSRNFMMVSRKQREMDPAAILAGVRDGGKELQDVLAQVRVKEAWQAFGPGSPVLTDDRPFLDHLQDRAFVARSDLELTRFAGTRTPKDVIERATAVLATRPRAALEILADAARATPRLRRLVGDARWFLRDLFGALAEYRAGLALSPTPTEQRTLEQRVKDAQEELQPSRHARTVASRNGWFALALFGLCALSWWLARRLLAPETAQG